MSRFDNYVMPEIRHRLDDESDVELVEEALRVTGVPHHVNRDGGEA